MRILKKIFSVVFSVYISIGCFFGCLLWLSYQIGMIKIWFFSEAPWWHWSTLFLAIPFCFIEVVSLGCACLRTVVWLPALIRFFMCDTSGKGFLFFLFPGYWCECG